MKARWILVLVVLSLLAIGGVAYAGTAGKRLSPMKAPMPKPGTDIISKVAEASGMTVQDVMKERRAGKSFNQILAAKGKNGDAIVAQAVAEFEAGLKKMMDDATAMPVPPKAPAGPRPGFGGFGLFGDVAKAAGMTVQEVMKERQAGKSLNEILAAKQKDSKAIVEQALAANKARLDKMVSAGKLAQDKADQIQTNYATQLDKMMNDKTAFPAAGPHSRGPKPPRAPSTK